MSVGTHHRMKTTLVVSGGQWSVVSGHFQRSVSMQVFRGVFVCCAMLACVACGSPTAPTTATGATGTLTIFAAASLTEAFGEIGTDFEAAHPGTKLTFNFAGSQQLAQQITQGAPVDVFASAHASQMNVVIDGGQVASGTQTIFVRNRLVIIYPIDNPAQITTIMDLAKPGLKLDLAAKEAPVGQYSLDFLDKASQNAAYGPAFKDAVINNIVSYEENVRAVLAKVTLGEIDAGIVYTSDVSQDVAHQVVRLDIPDELNTIAQYPIAPIKNSANATLAKQFIAYVRGEEGQAVLSKYGFLAPSIGN
jgi:molybdate transport system substrate-binding protein